MRLHTEPDTEWRNIFQLWRESGEVLPLKVAKSSWSAEAGHFLIVEDIAIKKWPYGTAWGQYHWKGYPARRVRKSISRERTLGKSFNLQATAQRGEVQGNVKRLVRCVTIAFAT
ncbi:hypothetical protein [Rhizobium leguminosarum]|uniref:hypothetical protein n=1 Tax=Rhizobium leguminosarum TaxID=384 RepID=UPI001C95A6C1|nr:hypothetical protein [Rhizobium leguminosarum]MBY5694683.1 hypothetical protein [Rhizobium leguminosarum]